MKKAEKEYLIEYGEVPDKLDERIKILLGSGKKLKGKIKPMIDGILGIKWERLTLEIRLVPKATPRPRYNGSHGIFYVKRASDNRAIFKEFIESANIPMIITPMKVYINSYLPTPNSMSKVEKVLAEMGLIRPISKPDWDNLGKTYSDMIQEQLILDDSLIIEGVSKKFYSIKPRIEITIDYMRSFDCAYNENKVTKILKKR